MENNSPPYLLYGSVEKALHSFYGQREAKIVFFTTDCSTAIINALNAHHNYPQSPAVVLILTNPKEYHPRKKPAFTNTHMVYLGSDPIDMRKEDVLLLIGEDVTTSKLEETLAQHNLLQKP